MATPLLTRRRRDSAQPRKPCVPLRTQTGDCIFGTDDEIRSALLEMQRATAYSATRRCHSFCGFQKAMPWQKITAQQKRLYSFITVNGLKDIESAISVCTMPAPVAPDSATIEAHVKSLI
jgi:hypothetical protein